MPPLTSATDDVADCLRAGGVVLLPTDTVYGLAALPTSERAIRRIFELKRRPPTVNLPILVAERDDIARLGGIVTTAAAQLLASRYVPGPLTLAVGIDAAKASQWLISRAEAAFRIPADDWLQDLLLDTGPILATSANMHATMPKETVIGILADLAGEPDLAIDGGPRATIASTLVNCNLDPAVVERVGAVPTAEIQAILS